MTASSCSRSSTSSRCTSTPRRVSRRSAARSRGRAAPPGRGRPAGRAGRRAAGRRRPRARPTPSRRAARPRSGAIGSGTRSRRPTPARSASCRQVSDSASRSARADQLGVEVGGDGGLGEQVAQVADPPLVGRPAGRGDDGLGDLLGRRPRARRGGEEAVGAHRPAAAVHGSRRTRRRRRAPRPARTRSRGDRQIGAASAATARRHAAKPRVHLHRGGRGLEDDGRRGRGSSNRPPGSPASTSARPVAVSSDAVTR